MRFTPREEFREGRMTFEPGNTYDSAKHGLSDGDVRRYHAAGWAEVEGMDSAPERKPGAQAIRPAKSTHEEG